jgi:hypothetical protein
LHYFYVLLSSIVLINHLPFWSFSHKEAFARVQSKEEGLSSTEAQNRLRQFGKNIIKESEREGKHFSAL